MKVLKQKKVWMPVVVIIFAVAGFFGFNYYNAHKSVDYYDDRFMTAMENGLEKRWEYGESIKSGDLTKAQYQKMVSIELDHIEEYSNKPFKDSKSQEAAIAYINAVKDTEKALDSYGSDSFDQKWTDAYDARTEKLVVINDIKPIEVSKKHQDSLDELLGSGKEVKQANDRDDKVKKLVDSIQFIKDDSQSFDDFGTYNATVTNNLGFTIKGISIVAKLKDASGTVLEERYLNASNWEDGEAHKFDFGTSDRFTTIEYSIEYVEYGDA